MKPRSCVRECTLLLMVLVAGPLGRGQPIASSLVEWLPSRQVVFEGRNVSFKGSRVQRAGSYQWQVSARDTTLWVDLADEGVYSGATTPSLEIALADLSMDGNSYRFILADESGRYASNPVRLSVLSLLLRSPVGIATNEEGVLFVTDTETHTVRRIYNAVAFGWGESVNCPAVLWAGSEGEAGTRDGFNDSIMFNHPGGVAGADRGDLMIADTANATLRLVSAARFSTTFAGSGTLRGNADGPASGATFGAPLGIARGPDGAFYVADAANHTLRKIAGDGVVSTLAGSPGNAGFADGRGSDARFHRPSGVAVGPDGRIYVSDTANNLIRVVSPDGEVRTVAGTVGVAGSDDGDGGSARFNGPTGLAAWGASVLIADTGNSTIRQLGENGRVSTLAGVAGVGGLRDGRGEYDAMTGRHAYDMLFNRPQGVCTDGKGLIFVADTGNAALRVIAYYEGAAMTMPVVPQSSFWSPPVLPPSSPPAPSVQPSPSGQPAGAGGAGGGALGLGWLATLAGLRLLTAFVGCAGPPGRRVQAACFTR